MNSHSFLQLEEHQADGMSNGGYRLIPESLRQQEDMTLSQALFLSLFLFGKNQTRTNKELASLYNPSKDTSTQVPQIFIRKLVDKNYLTVHGKGKARKVMPTLKALKFVTGKQLYLIVHQDIMMAPVSGSRKMFHAAQRKLDRAGATGLAKTIGRGLRPATVAVSGQIFLSGEPMYPDQYNQPANQSPAKPKPKSKQFSYSNLALPQRRARHKKKPPDIPSSHRAEIQSIAHL